MRVAYGPVFLILFICSLSYGCGGDPVSDYQQFVKNELERMDQTSLKITGEYKFNVRKTDSLVSPLLGTCTFPQEFVFKDEVNGNPTELKLWVTTTLNHGYQDGQWVFTTGDHFIERGKVIKDHIGINLSVLQQMTGQTIQFDSMSAISDFIE